ncbi:MAG: C39 family peptidase [Desulfobacteraceae bacterium]
MSAKSSKSPFFLSISHVTFFLFFLSCAPSTHLDKQSVSNIIEEVPFYQLKAYQCGPASLASVVNFWGIAVSPTDIAEEIYSESARGTLNVDMALYAEGKGLRAKQFKGSIDDIKRNVDMGYPLIVMVDYGFWVYERNHFMVIAGYNEDGVMVNSGTGYPELVTFKDFLMSWGRTNFWTLLITPKS